MARPAVAVRGPASPRLLIGLILISLLGMHFLSGRNSAGHHLVLTQATTTSPVLPTGWSVDAGIRSVDITAVEQASAAFVVADGSHGDQITVIGCALLLLVGLGTALACWLRRRSVDDRTPAHWYGLHVTCRGPPRPVARLVLCMQRT